MTDRTLTDADVAGIRARAEAAHPHAFLRADVLALLADRDALLVRAETAERERDRTTAHAKAMSEALIKVRPLGGSELFVRVGDKFYADPKYCGDLIEEHIKKLHEANCELVRKAKALAALDRAGRPVEEIAREIVCQVDRDWDLFENRTELPESEWPEPAADLVVHIAAALASRAAVGDIETNVARAMCGDDHLACTYPDCSCKVVPKRVPAVMAIIASALTAERLAAGGREERMRKLIQVMLDNDPNEDAADGVSVLDVWRKEAGDLIARSE